MTDCMTPKAHVRYRHDNLDRFPIADIGDTDPPPGSRCVLYPGDRCGVQGDAGERLGVGWRADTRSPRRALHLCPSVGASSLPQSVSAELLLIITT